MLVEECFKLVWVAYGLTTERASNVMLDIAVIAGTVERVAARKKDYAQS